MIQISNSGGQDLAGVRVTNTVPGSISAFYPYGSGATWPSGSGTTGCDAGESMWWNLGGTLAAGQSTTLTFAMPVSATAADGTVLTDVVSIWGTNGAGAVVGASVSANVLVEAAPALRMALEADQDPVSPGQAITYMLRYMNAGSASLTGAVMRLQMPEGVTFVSASGGGATNGAEVSWALGTLRAGASGVRTLRVRVDPAVGAGSMLVAVGEVLDGSGAAGAKAKLASVVSAGSPLVATMTMGPDGVKAGELVHVVVTIANRGATELGGLRVQNVVPGSITTFFPYLSGASWPTGVGGSSGCDPGESMWWNLGGTLAAGESTTLSFAMPVHGYAADGTVLTDVVSIWGTNGAGAVVGASVSANVLVEAAPALRLTLEADQNPVSSGQAITYSLRYMNAGSASLTGAVMRLQMPEGVTFVSASGGATNGAEVSWALGTLRAGASGVRTLRVRVDPAVGAGSMLVAVGEVMDGSGATGAKTKLASVVSAGSPLVATVTMGPDGVKAGELVHVVVTIANRGATELGGLGVQNVVPGSITTFFP